LAAIVLMLLRTKEISRNFGHTTQKECEAYHTTGPGLAGISRRARKVAGGQ